MAADMAHGHAAGMLLYDWAVGGGERTDQEVGRSRVFVVLTARGVSCRANLFCLRRVSLIVLRLAQPNDQSHSQF